MALFTDGSVVSVDDLAGHDSALLTVAAAEGIDLTKKLSLAMDELSIELGNMLPAGDNLGCVAVTPAIRLWHAFRTLALVYRDAYSNQLNDRYAGKRDQFTALAQWAFDKLMEGGVGMVSHPVPKATPAVMGFLAGLGSGATYYVCNSWLNVQGQEGAVSEWAAISVPDGNVLSVTATNPPGNAAGWNVYIGLSPDSISQQNREMLLVGQPWLQENAVSTTSRVPGTGQSPDFVRLVARILQRG